MRVRVGGPYLEEVDFTWHVHHEELDLALARARGVHGVELDVCDVLGLGRPERAVARRLRRTHVAVVPADLVGVGARARVRVG